jgi:hypothetical protein
LEKIGQGQGAKWKLAERAVWPFLEKKPMPLLNDTRLNVRVPVSRMA